jgi:hypothetical protein
MRGALTIAALLELAACGATPEAAPKGNRTSLRGPLLAQRIALPDGERRFPEPGGALINRNCLSCHSADMLLYQPPLSETQWRATIEKMRDAFHAPIAEADIPGLLAELTALPAQRP